MSVRERIEALRARADARTRRERLLLFAALAVVVLLVWELTLRAPLQQRWSQAASQAGQIRQETQELRTSLKDIEQQLEQARSGEGNQRLRRLQKRLNELDQGLRKRTKRLISPGEMVDVVRDMVAADDALQLVELRNLPVESVIKQKTAEQGGKDLPRVYRHGVELVIEGDYFAILAYLQRLEGLRWAFQWNSLELERTEYPTARARISLATLSLEEGWIGV